MLTPPDWVCVRPSCTGVNASVRGGYYREGVFAVDAPMLAWSYLHTHAYWVSEVSLYLNATAASLGLDQSVLSTRLREGLSNDEVVSTQRLLHEREARSGARRVCHFLRTAAPIERVSGMGEVRDVFYRKSMGCVPFEVVRGMPFVAVVFTSPDSSAAAAAPMDGIAPVHTFIRLFANVAGVLEPTCNLGGRCYCWVGGTLEAGGCASTVTSAGAHGGEQNLTSISDQGLGLDEQLTKIDRLYNERAERAEMDEDDEDGDGGVLTTRAPRPVSSSTRATRGWSLGRVAEQTKELVVAHAGHRNVHAISARAAGVVLIASCAAGLAYLAIREGVGARSTMSRYMRVPKANAADDKLIETTPAAGSASAMGLTSDHARAFLGHA